MCVLPQLASLCMLGLAFSPFQLTGIFEKGRLQENLWYMCIQRLLYNVTHELALVVYLQVLLQLLRNDLCDRMHRANIRL